MTPGQAAFEKWNTPARMPGWEKLASWQKIKWEEIAQAAVRRQLANQSGTKPDA